MTRKGETPFYSFSPKNTGTGLFWLCTRPMHRRRTRNFKYRLITPLSSIRLILNPSTRVNSPVLKSLLISLMVHTDSHLLVSLSHDSSDTLILAGI